MKYPWSIVPVAVALAMLAMLAHARTADLSPVSITCEQVNMMLTTHNLPNTAWGRAKARVIALAQYGVVLTKAQIEEAARCLPPKRTQ